MSTPDEVSVRFPTLGDSEIDRLIPLGEKRQVKPGELLFDRGDETHGVFVVVEGAIEALGVSRSGETVIQILGRGMFTGEVNMLSGRRSLVRCRAREASTVIEISRQALRRMMQTEGAIGDIFLRAFIARRVYLVANSVGDAVLIGSRFCAETLRVRNFLARNGHPYTYLELEEATEMQAFLDQLEIRPDDIPVLICRGELVLRCPSDAEVAECFGLNVGVDRSGVYDLIVVGAGPSGLAAAVYGASEGLRVLVLEGAAPGGQAGTSSRIENYLGFPMGISGQELTDRAFIQAEKFGAQILVARGAKALRCNRSPYRIELDDGASVEARAVILAAGAQYRKPNIERLGDFEGVGVYYGATQMERQLCLGEDVVVVGGGNSAGQAALYLSESSRHVYLAVRRSGLAETMSRYLISRIEASDRITVKPLTQIEALDGGQHVESIRLRDLSNNATETRTVRHLFLMTGADPKTQWLDGCVALDEKGFVRTGPDVGGAWPEPGPPYLLETSLPGVFAVGDIRAGSVKRVASAVGEGSMAVQFVHRVLAGERVAVPTGAHA